MLAFDAGGISWTEAEKEFCQLTVLEVADPPPVREVPYVRQS